MANVMAHLDFLSISSRSPGTAVLIDRLDRLYFHGSGMFVAVNGAIPNPRLAVYSLKSLLDVWT